MALPKNINQREFDKFAGDSAGNVAIRTTSSDKPDGKIYREICIDTSLTSGTATQIDTSTGKDGTNSIDSLATTGYKIKSVFIQTEDVAQYNMCLLVMRGGTTTSKIVTDINFNEGGKTLQGDETNNSFIDNELYVKSVGYTGNVSIVVGFWY